MMKALSATLLLASLSPVAHAQVEWNEIPPSDETYRASASEYREGIYEIPVAAGGALEYKLSLQEGDSIVYHWAAEMEDPSLLKVEFHGHTEPVNGRGDLMFYKVHAGSEEQGMLTAPFSGIHGWYLDNQSEQDIVVLLRVAGFYEVVPDQL